MSSRLMPFHVPHQVLFPLVFLFASGCRTFVHFTLVMSYHVHLKLTGKTKYTFTFIARILLWLMNVHVVTSGAGHFEPLAASCTVKYIFMKCMMSIPVMYSRESSIVRIHYTPVVIPVMILL